MGLSGLIRLFEKYNSQIDRNRFSFPSSETEHIHMIKYFLNSHVFADCLYLNVLLLLKKNITHVDHFYVFIYCFHSTDIIYVSRRAQ